MIGGDFDTPIMYQDLANYTMNPMYPVGMPFGGMVGGIGSTPYLGGVQMRPQLDHDKVQLMNKKSEEGKSTFKKALLGIGACLLLGFIPVVRKGIKNSGGVWEYLKGLFSKQPAKQSWWQRFKNKFKKTPATGGTQSPSKWSKFKGWCGSKWSSVRNVFKKKTPTPASTQTP